MTVVLGLEASFQHNQNGMTKADMVACGDVAKDLNEVIIFRSTGPWAKRWIEKGYPTKNFHVKGKSSDWGPHAGLVPYDGTWSKVGYDVAKAKKGTEANDDGLKSGFAGKIPLVLTVDQIREQERRPEGRPPRTALFAVAALGNAGNLTLTGRRSGDGRQIIFNATKRGDGRYDISVIPPGAGGLVRNNAFTAADRGATGILLEVMTSNEDGVNLPMTGDYDLMAICPTWADYGSLSSRGISKDGITLTYVDKKTGQKVTKTMPGLDYAEGIGMDNVLDSRLSTGGTKSTDFRHRVVGYRSRYGDNKMNGSANEDTYRMIFEHSPYGEHADMGNLTPRILRCIVSLNAKMGATGEKSALRRVHHNAESHRFRQFGALTAEDMVTIKDGEAYGDGFPLTIFQPPRLVASGKPAAQYGAVCTLENLPEFKVYAMDLAASGYYVPRNWIWGMHVPPSAYAERNRNLVSAEGWGSRPG